jgi:hypothetical protein
VHRSLVVVYHHHKLRITTTVYPPLGAPMGGCARGVPVAGVGACPAVRRRWEGGACESRADCQMYIWQGSAYCRRYVCGDGADRRHKLVENEGKRGEVSAVVLCHVYRGKLEEDREEMRMTAGPHRHLSSCPANSDLSNGTYRS